MSYQAPGVKLPVTWIQAINPLIILCGIPLLNRFWEWQALRGMEAGPIVKMAIGTSSPCVVPYTCIVGCLISAISYSLMMIAALSSQGDTRQALIPYTSSLCALTTALI